MFTSHLADKENLINECNKYMTVIPGRLRPLFQPLDVCKNKPFKGNLKREWKTWMLEGEKKLLQTETKRSRQSAWVNKRKLKVT